MTSRVPAGKTRGRDGKLYPSSRPRRRLLLVSARLIRRRTRDGASLRELADEYGVSHTTVRNALRRAGVQNP